MIDCPKYCYCNYCKYFVVPQNVGLMNMTGLCSKKPGRIISHMCRWCWEKNCKDFEYTIHPKYGFDSETELKQYKKFSYIVHVKDYIHWTGKFC